LPTSDQVGFSPRKHSPDGATAHIRLTGLLLIYRPRMVTCRYRPQLGKSRKRGL